MVLVKVLVKEVENRVKEVLVKEVENRVKDLVKVELRLVLVLVEEVVMAMEAVLV